jgi:hypothetical protein
MSMFTAYQRFFSQRILIFRINNNCQNLQTKPTLYLNNYFLHLMSARAAVKTDTNYECTLLGFHTVGTPKIVD